MIASIMMVTYNRLDLTKQTLECLFKNTDYPYNIVFIDNASQDGTTDYLYKTCADKMSEDEFFQGFKILKNNKNLGIATGRNQALHASEGEWLVTIDNDVLVPSGWLTEAINILQTNPSYGMIGVNMEDVNYPIVKNGEKEWQSKPKGNLGTACAVFNRTLHQLLGYFSLDYPFYAHEDADFGMRVRVAGFKLGYIKENGKHIGSGDNDKGEYREFKNSYHTANLAKFHENCKAYHNRRKSLYVPFKL